ncbi:hypothetical protein AMJ87_13335 [candidate division WOR_3 bacterium SM23_60]|uniref:Uncharacterized protein n=1 Tax=candidate division WOR_3 bacterium SM23_60 TaxID=1703780 RepID=A0A0S8G5G9_UNCW3|nr:MAG: hypothetical protein AMJ87_13335 [candidate division WOR_3 bacterium SM23_60]
MIEKMYNYKTVILFCIVALFFITVCARKSDLQKGIEAIDKGDYVKAVEYLQNTTSNDPLNQEAYFHLCLAYAYLDSVDKSYHTYLRLISMQSPFKDSSQLKEILAHFLNLEPYVWHLVPMKMNQQFKGVMSPDGQAIAVAAATRDRANIYLISLDGTIIKKITKSGMNTDPDFSPDGKHLVFVSDVDGDEDIYFYSIEDGHIEKLTDNTAQDFSPSFSPDGSDIVFISNMHDTFKWEIYKVNVNTKRTKRLTNNRYWDGFPKFSSDGKSIVYSSKRNGSEDIYIMNTNGGNEQVLYASDADENDPFLKDDVLFFKSNRDDSWEIYRYDVKGKLLMRLTYNAQPDWNPRVTQDGMKMVVARKVKNRWRLYFANCDISIPAELIVKKIKEQLSPQKE